MLIPNSVTEPPVLLKLFSHELRWQLLSVLSLSDYRVNELSKLLQKPLNLISYHLRLLRDQAVVNERRSDNDSREVYYSLDLERFQKLYISSLESMHPILSAPKDNLSQTESNRKPPARVLFLCTHNSARSQIAEALLRHLGGGRVEVFSGGTEPSTVHPMALEVLQKEGIDTTGLYSKSIEQFIQQSFDYVITVCDRAKESCPILPGEPEQIHWSFPDPSSVANPDEQRLAFTQVFVGMEKRLQILMALLDRNWGSK